jgi:hypothetical protein
MRGAKANDLAEDVSVTGSIVWSMVSVISFEVARGGCGTSVAAAGGVNASDLHDSRRAVPGLRSQPQRRPAHLGPTRVACAGELPGLAHLPAPQQRCAGYSPRLQNAFPAPETMVDEGRLYIVRGLGTFVSQLVNCWGFPLVCWGPNPSKRPTETKGHEGTSGYLGDCFRRSQPS